MSEARDPAIEQLLDSTIFDPGEHLDRSAGEIARGGMAVVECAVDRTLGRRVALKMLHGELADSMLAVRSFLREAQITGQLDHPNIVPVHELAIDDGGQLYFAMKLVEGRTLLEQIHTLRAEQKRMGRSGALISTTVSHDDLLRQIEVFLKVLDAVGFAHARGVAHCDIKPENVMVGDFGQVYLMDWGIAKVLDEATAPPPNAYALVHRVKETMAPQRGMTFMVMGTPSYMSPEQARGDQRHVDHRSDIFCLGSMLFEILTGHPPYQGIDANDELEQARACQSVLLPHLAIPPGLRHIVGVAMNPDPDARFQSVEEFRAALQGFMRGGDNFPRRRFAKGQMLIREGEPGDAAYILVSGRCEVSKKIDGKAEVLNTLGPGDVFGETAILASMPRTASIVALTEVVAVIVTAEVLEREVAAMKPWMGSFIRVLAQRFSAATHEFQGGKVEPAQIAHLAYMTLTTYGEDSPEGRTMPALELCEIVAASCSANADRVFKTLHHFSYFDLDIAFDTITLCDKRGLLKELEAQLF